MTDPASLADDLAAWGKVILIETRGRSSGRPRLASVGFLEDGSSPPAYRVAASDDSTHWARNLLSDGRCYVIAGGVRSPYRATPLGGADRAAVAMELILKYGTPSERLGGGPAFRLEALEGPRADHDPS